MSSETKQILTTDGIPLEVSLKKAERKNKIKAFLLVAPLLLFLIITYVFPIGDMLLRSVDDSQINTVYSKTFEEYKKWDSENEELPPCQMAPRDAASRAHFSTVTIARAQIVVRIRINICLS